MDVEVSLNSNGHPAKGWFKVRIYHSTLLTMMMMFVWARCIPPCTLIPLGAER